MEVAPAAAMRPCGGYFVWLALQCLVRLVATQNGFHEARWLLVAVAAMWVFVEVASRMLRRDDLKTDNHSLAHALAQLLLQHMRIAAPKEFVGSFSVLLAADLLFLALPVLLHVFKPWPSTAETAGPMVSAEEQQQVEKEEDGDAAVKAAAALVVTAVAAGASDGAEVLRSTDLEEFAPNLTAIPERPREAVISPDPADLMKLLCGNSPNGKARPEFRRRRPPTSADKQPPGASLLLMEGGDKPVKSPAVMSAPDDLDDRSPAQRLKDAELYHCIFRRNGWENGPVNTSLLDGPNTTARKEASGRSGAVVRDALWPSASPTTGKGKDVQQESPSVTPQSNMDAASRCIMAALWQTPELKQAATEPCISSGACHKSPHAHTEVCVNAEDIKKPLSPAATKKQPELPGGVISGFQGAPSPEATTLTNLTRQDLLKHLQEQTAKAKEQLRQQQAREATPTKRGREGRGFEGLGDTKNDNSQQQQVWMHGTLPEALRTSSSKPVKFECVSFQGARQASPLSAPHKPVVGSSGVASTSPSRGQVESGRGRVDSPARGKAEEVSERPKHRRRETEEESFDSTEASSIYKAPRDETGTKNGQQPPHRHDHSLLGAGVHHHPHCPLYLHKAHAEQHDLAPPSPGGASGAATAEEWKKGPPCRGPSSKLLEVPPEPVIPVVVQPPPPEDKSQSEGNRDRNSAFHPSENGENIRPEVNPPHRQSEGARAQGKQRSPSPVERSAILDPFASPSAQSKPPPHSVFWGRAGAFGASGTPMVSPRLLSGQHESRKAVDDSGVQRHSELPFGVERLFQPSPNITLRCIDTSELEGEGAAWAKNWRDRGERMHAGAKQFFGTPSVLSRDPNLHGPSGKMRDDINRLRELAVQRRGKAVNSTPANKEEARFPGKKGASSQPSPVPISGSPPPHTLAREWWPHLTPLGESPRAEAAEDSDHKSPEDWREYMQVQDGHEGRLLGPPPGFREVIGDLSRAAMPENQRGAEATGTTPIVVVTPVRLSPSRSPQARTPGRSESPGLVTIGAIPLFSPGNVGLGSSESGEPHQRETTNEEGIDGMIYPSELAGDAAAEAPIIVTLGPLPSEGLDWEDVDEKEKQQRPPVMM
ncbi:hypothetical protein ACSSS7_000537 [Eimeria intestinalis]